MSDTPGPPLSVLRLADVDLAYTDTGDRSISDATPVLALHGFAGSGDAIADLTERLSATRRVVAPDLAGHGHTVVKGTAGSHSMAAAVGHVKALARHIGDPVDLLGYSMGGRAALSAAVACPEMVRSLILIGASPGLATEAERAERRAADDALAARIEANGIGWFLEHWASLPLWSDRPMTIEPRFRELLDVQAERARPEGLAASLREMGTGSMPPLHDSLAEIGCPTLLLAGDEDEKYTAIGREMERAIGREMERAIGREMERAIQGSRFETVPHAGHRAHLNNPTFVAETILSFLAEVSALPTTNADAR